MVWASLCSLEVCVLYRRQQGLRWSSVFSILSLLSSVAGAGCRQTCSPNGFKGYFEQFRAPFSDPQTIQKPFLLASFNTATRSENPSDAPKPLTHIQVLSLTTIVNLKWRGCCFITISISLSGCGTDCEHRVHSTEEKNRFVLSSSVLGRIYKGYPSHLFIFVLSVKSSQISDHMQADATSTNVHSRSMSVY